MTEPGGLVLRIERTFDAPIEDVFDAWTNEEVLRRWIHAGPDWETPTAEVDLRVGGRVRVVMREPADGAEHGAVGEYTVIEPPHRLAFTWVWDDDPDNPQMIELEFSERDGATTVLMINSGIPTDQRRRSQQGGWHRCYDNLDRIWVR
jgi:uncharacterized protein YndB with AHSA1/START domain